ncbi:glycosidase [Halioglobus maricola]|uniref:4-O-beta-D-mannosyl-D-glucose phosphorylase n=1 Tax=Halioglobus maricola TaxID=2601894 RepID=A0A5P9NN82_9GAMM|nr:glycosidase [Halioglobus maricola]QFU77333.1 glycosidase [Halioglobus maricola]
MEGFDARLELLREQEQALLAQVNSPAGLGNGVVQRWQYPVVTAAHVPIEWRYDLNPDSNPFLLERLAVNAAFNAGAILWRGKYVLAVRVEGADRKSFFALAESDSGTQGFRFTGLPLVIPETDEPDTNVYDMRLVAHADGWVYGLFCAERPDPDMPGDTSAAVAAGGIVRSQDLQHWERLPDLVTESGQQRNVVLHPEFIDGKYAFYTRGQDGFIDVGRGGGIGFGLVEDIQNPRVEGEVLVDAKAYHTIKELKNGLGPAPLKTSQGWLHLAHGVRSTAAGLRYVLYLFLSELERPWQVTHQPAGHFMAPEGLERVGDVSNVLFSNGWIVDDDGTVYIYYASSDTRLHVATSSVERLLDYVTNTPADGLRSAASVQHRTELIQRNRALP